MTTPKAPTRDEARVLLNNIDLYVEDGMQPEYDAIRRYITHLEQSREAELEEAFRAGWDGRSDWKHPTYKHPGADDFDRAYRDYKQRKGQV